MSLVDRLKQKNIEVINGESYWGDYFKQSLQPFVDEACRDFDPQEIRTRFNQLVQTDRELGSLDWGQCRFATYEASQRLDDFLHPYAPTYCALFAQGNVNGAPTGHIWLATEVCNQTYITDIVGAGFYAGIFGFGFHTFDHDQTTFFEDSYHDFAITTAHCSSQPLDMEDDDSFIVMDKAQNKLDDAREIAGTLTLWERFVRWMQK